MLIKKRISPNLRIFVFAFLSLTGVLLTLLSLVAVDVYAYPLNMTLLTTYQDNAPANSIEGARGMQIDAARKIAFISSNTDASLTAINFSNPFSLSVYGSVNDAAPVGSLDGIWFGSLDTATNIFYAPSATDSTTSWYNVSTGTFVFLNDTAADTAGAGSQQGERDVSIVDIGSTKWLITGGLTDDYVSSFNVTNPRIRPAVVGSFTDSLTACTVDGMSNVYNIPGTSYVVVTATVDSYVTLLNISPAGAITCVGSGYTDTAGAGSIQGLQYVFYENSTGYLYVTSPTDGYLTILQDVLTGTPTLVGSVGGLAAPVSVTVSPTLFDGTKYAFVGSSSAGQGIRVINITDPAAPTLVSVFNQTSGTCVYNGVYSMNVVDNYLYVTSGVDACFYSIVLGDNLMNVSLSSPMDNYVNDTSRFVNLTFNATVTDDDGLVNCSLWTNYSGTWELNQTQNIGGVSNFTSFNLTGLTNATFVWNIQCFDIFSHSAFALADRTVILNWTDTPPDISLSFPYDDYTNSVAQFVNLTFNATVTDDKMLVNCSLWTNYSGTWQRNQTRNVSGVSNFTSFNLTGLTNKTFVWNIQCFDSGLQSSFALTNRTVILNWNPVLDTPPGVSLSSPSDNYLNSTSQFVNLTFTAFATDDTRLVNCSLWTNYSGTWQRNQTQNIGGVSNFTSFNLTGLTNNTFIWNIQCFDNATQSTFDSTNRTVILNWTPPLMGNFSVQKYYISLGAGVTSGFAPFTGGQSDFNAVPFVTMRSSFSATNDFWNLFLPDVYFNSTGVIVTRNAGGSSTMDVIVNVVQFDPNAVRVQSGTFSLISGSNTSIIDSNVDLSNSALIFYYLSTDATDDYIANSIRGNISGVNELNFSVSGTTGTKSGHWYVFESLDGNFTVQSTTLNFATTSTSASGTISSVNISKTFLITSYITSENSDDPRDGSFYVNLSSPTTVTGVRLGVPSATINANVYVVTFSGVGSVRHGYFSYTAGTASNSDSFSAVNLNSSMAWNPVLTGRMADDSTLSAIESSFQLLNLTSFNTISGSRSESVGNAGGTWEIIEWIPTGVITIESVTIDDNITPVDEIILSAGSTRLVNCSVVASDSESLDNILNASATFYYYLNDSSDPDNNMVHYSNSSCTLVSTTSINKTFSCVFNVYYYANNGTWNCNATVYSAVSDSPSVNVSTLINPLYAINITDGMAFGSTEPNLASTELRVNMTNLGNMPINISVLGYARTIGDNYSMNCSDGTNLSVGAARYSLTTSIFSAKTALTAGGQMLPLTMQKPSSLSAVLNYTYWQIMPDPYVGSASRYCEGYILFSAESS